MNQRKSVLSFIQNVTLKEQLSTFVKNHQTFRKIMFHLLLDLLKSHLKLKSPSMRAQITTERKLLIPQAKIALIHSM